MFCISTRRTSAVGWTSPRLSCAFSMCCLESYSCGPNSLQYTNEMQTDSEAVPFSLGRTAQ